MKRKNIFSVFGALILFIFIVGGSNPIGAVSTGTPVPKRTGTHTVTPRATLTRTGTPSAFPSRTITPSPSLTPTHAHMTYTPSPVITVTQAITRTPDTSPDLVLPYHDAPACADNNGDGHADVTDNQYFGEIPDNELWHSLWNSVGACHYDHEHGTSPFTLQVAQAFPGFDLFALLGNVEMGHTNPSSPMENTHKHGGMKWQVTFRPCAIGFEDATYGVDSIAIQYHAFGDYSIEFEARVHSAVALARQCVPGSTDYGYVFVNQHQNYGQRLFSYQGLNMPYPDAPAPSYPVGLGPYFTNQCIFCGAKQDTRAAILSANGNVPTTWTSKGGRVLQQTLFTLLFRGRDGYQVADQRDQTYPFTYVWMCSADGGLSFASVANCRYNNSTTRVHEVKFIIPAEWDGLENFDTDPRPGRITADGFVDSDGNLNNCLVPEGDCFPIKLVNAYVGHTGAELQLDKTQQFTAIGLPERDIYFCNGIPCTETNSGAVPSGWIGASN